MPEGRLMIINNSNNCTIIICIIAPRGSPDSSQVVDARSNKPRQLSKPRGWKIFSHHVVLTVGALFRLLLLASDDATSRLFPPPEIRIANIQGQQTAREMPSVDIVYFCHSCIQRTHKPCDSIQTIQNVCLK